MNTLARLFVATAVVVLASAASAKEPFRGDPISESLPFVTQARAQAAAADSHYEGVIKLKYDTIPFCLDLSPVLVDEFDGDPDMHHKFVHQDAWMSEMTPFGPQGCDTKLQHNGSYIRNCDGYYMTDAVSLSHGEVYTTVARFDQFGNRIVEPIGTWTMSRVERCSRF